MDFLFYYSCPLGRWVLKYRSFFLFSIENVHWIFGIMWCVFWLQANSTARCRRCFVAEFFQIYIVFLVVAIFAKTECCSPSYLLVRSATYHTSATYQLLTCRKWYVASFQAFHDHFSHETYKHHASTVTCSESKWKNPPCQNDHSRQKQTTCWKYFFVSITILGHEYTGSASLVTNKLVNDVVIARFKTLLASLSPPPTRWWLLNENQSGDKYATFSDCTRKRTYSAIQ